jgi:TFIIF-interacting CTD phosphatase-like protein
MSLQKYSPRDLRLAVEKIRASFRPLPARASNKKLTLVLDLDSTLLHSSTTPLPGGKMYSPGLYTVLRPGVFNFLNTLSSRVELIVFTAGTRQYAEHMANALDPLHHHIKYIFARDETLPLDDGGYYKFLEILNNVGTDRRQTRPLHTVLMIDDNPQFVHPSSNVIVTTKYEGVENDPLFFQRVISHVQSVLRIL